MRDRVTIANVEAALNYYTFVMGLTAAQQADFLIDTKRTVTNGRSTTRYRLSHFDGAEIGFPLGREWRTAREMHDGLRDAALGVNCYRRSFG
jgi:hypothetical protein